MKTSKDPDVMLLLRLDGGLTEHGDQPADAGDVDFIPTERVPALIALMNEADGPVQKYVRNQAAIYLAEWGHKEGVKYIEAEMSKPAHERTATHKHRIGAYDITPELFMRALVGYWCLADDEGRSDEAKLLVRPGLRKIVIAAMTERFEIHSILSWAINDHFGRQNLVGDDNVLKDYLCAMLDQNDNGKQGYKPKDAVKFFEKYDPDFLKQELKALLTFSF